MAQFGADFHVILDHRIADLGNLVVVPGMGGIAEPVLPDAGASMDHDAIAENRVIVEDDVWVEDAIAAYPRGAPT